MRAFEGAFLVQAEAEPDLRETIKTVQLREQTHLQAQLLEAVQEMSRRITGGGTPSVEAERIEAGSCKEVRLRNCPRYRNQVTI